MRQIDRASNLANAMTKANPNKALQELINTNKLKVKMEE